MHLDSNWTIKIIMSGMHQSIIISDTLRFHGISTRLSFRTICLQITQVVFLEILLHNLYIVVKLLSRVGPYSLLHQSLLISVRFSDFICCICPTRVPPLVYHQFPTYVQGLHRSSPGTFALSRITKLIHIVHLG